MKRNAVEHFEFVFYKKDSNEFSFLKKKTKKNRFLTSSLILGIVDTSFKMHFFN